MRGEGLIARLLLGIALCCVLVLALIALFLVHEGLPAFASIGVREFLLGRDWYPTGEPPAFGALPLVLASAWITAGAMALAIPLGVGTALYLSEVAAPTTRDLLKPFLELLAGVPSVVFGFFGMVVVAPWVQRLFGLPSGLTGLSASLVLGIMALPTVVSLSEDALSAVPQSYREASLALGATRVQTSLRVVLPAALPGVCMACILGMARAIGETMTVLMVAGGAAVIPHGLLQPMRPLTATIVAEMGEAVHGSLHYHALFALGLVLFLISLALNVAADAIGHRFRGGT